MTNLFGALDATSIPEVPEDGTHPFILKTLRTTKTRTGVDKLVMSFVLDDADSPFNGHKIDKWFTIYPELNDLSDLDDDDQVKAIRDINTLKKWLRMLNVPEDELGTVDFNALTGTRGFAYGIGRDKYDGSGKEWYMANFQPE